LFSHLSFINHPQYLLSRVSNDCTTHFFEEPVYDAKGESYLTFQGVNLIFGLSFRIFQQICLETTETLMVLIIVNAIDNTWENITQNTGGKYRNFCLGFHMDNGRI